MPSPQAACPRCGAPSELWCSAKDEEYGTLNGRAFAYFCCKRCEVLFVGEDLVPQLREIYPSSYYSFGDDSYGTAYRVKYFFDKIKFRRILSSFESASLSVLDVGGGVGSLAAIVKGCDERVRDVVIVDLDEKAALAAKQRGFDYHVGRIEDFESHKSFDLIILFNILEHVQDPWAMLRQCASVLAEDGKILVQTPSFASWDARLFRGRYWGGLHAPRHFTILTQASLRTAASEAELQVEQLWHTQSGPFLAYSLLGSAGLGARQDKLMSDRVIYWPLIALLSILDFTVSWFRPTSQMRALLSKRPPQRRHDNHTDDA